MPKITINYNYNTDKTTINVSRDFALMPLIHQADALRDALHKLEIIYNNTLAKTFSAIPEIKF